MTPHLLDSALSGAPWPGCLKNCGAEQEEALGVSVAGSGLERMLVFLVSGESPGLGAKQGSLASCRKEFKREP